MCLTFQVLLVQGNEDQILRDRHRGRGTRFDAKSPPKQAYTVKMVADAYDALVYVPDGTPTAPL